MQRSAIGIFMMANVKFISVRGKAAWACFDWFVKSEHFHARVFILERIVIS